MDAKVLKLAWPPSIKPADLPNFEQQARRLRYRALGLACREHGIDRLLLGHHADDQAETVLMRLIEGRHGPGLRGIKLAAEIPECGGLHGVNQSGRIVPGGKSELDVEAGGVKILRPLLGFSKERLVRTCQEAKIDWVEDATNRNPKLTMRNAVRYLSAKHKLPAALSKPSLLGLSKIIRDGEEQYIKQGDKLFDRCNIELDTRTGLARIRFPVRAFDTRWKPLEQIEDARQVAANLLRRIIQLVSPLLTIELQSARTAAESIFPELSDSLSRSASEPARPFCAKRVYFRPEPTTTHNHTQPSDPLQTITWHLSRQPFSNKTFKDPKSRPSVFIPIPPATISGLPTSQKPPFHLWDSRFWISVHNPTAIPLIIRPLMPHDLKPFGSSLRDSHAKNMFRKLLDDVAPGGPQPVRFTLPVLATAPDDSVLTGEVISFPTLEAVNRLARKDGGLWEDVRVEARYRNVDLEMGTGDYCV